MGCATLTIMLINNAKQPISGFITGRTGRIGTLRLTQVTKMSVGPKVTMNDRPETGVGIEIRWPGDVEGHGTGVIPVRHLDCARPAQDWRIVR